MLRSKNTIAIPPGATIREQLEIRGMKQKEFAIRMGLSEKHISHLINGQVELTHDVALRLESVLGVPASFWNNLEASFREKLIRVATENDLEHDMELASRFPYSKIADLGWVNATRNLNEKAINLRSFFEVAKLEVLEHLRIPGIVYRRTGENKTSDYALAVWAQKARIEARHHTTAPINISKLKQSIERIRSMTIKKPENFCTELSNLLDECGIALVFLPHIGGSFLHGASFYDGDHIVMGLTVRGKDADKFWFSLFHELCHIIRGHLNEFAEFDNIQEEEADVYARDILIPPECYQKLISTNCFTKEAIISFASEVGIAPGIVLGRLQKENFIPYNMFNDLKERYEIA